MSKIINEYKASKVMEGAGVKVNRVFGQGQTKAFDPFLMLDYFENDKDVPSPGFPWHPHKGIETITYFTRGSGLHEDSMGNKGVIGPGELQWMSAGKGIYHQEMPGETPDGVQGFQFWLNLPAQDKLNEPAYQYIKNGEMKSVVYDGVTVKVISGNYQDIAGPIDKARLAITMLHVLVEEGRSISLTRDDDKQGYIFVFSGEGHLDNAPIRQIAAYTLDSGDLTIKADKGVPMEFIFAQGRPLNEPIAWRGPIVMNTSDEIYETFQDLNDGTFAK